MRLRYSRPLLVTPSGLTGGGVYRGTERRDRGRTAGNERSSRAPPAGSQLSIKKLAFPAVCRRSPARSAPVNSRTRVINVDAHAPRSSSRSWRRRWRDSASNFREFGVAQARRHPRTTMRSHRLVDRRRESSAVIRSDGVASMVRWNNRSSGAGSRTLTCGSLFGTATWSRMRLLGTGNMCLRDAYPQELIKKKWAENAHSRLRIAY
jgi:hypothetical protein